MAKWSDIFDAFTSIDEKLDELNKNIRKLLEVIAGKKVTVITPQPPVSVTPTTTTPTAVPISRIITIPGRVTPLLPVTLTVTPDKDLPYNLMGDVTIILADGDDIYINIKDTTVTGVNNFKLTDGVGIVLNMGNITLHFRSVSTTAYVRIWEFIYE